MSSTLEQFNGKLSKVRGLPSNSTQATQAKISAYMVLENEIRDCLKTKLDSDTNTKLQNMYSKIREESLSLSEHLISDTPPEASNNTANANNTKSENVNNNGLVVTTKILETETHLDDKKKEYTVIKSRKWTN